MAEAARVGVLCSAACDRLAIGALDPVGLVPDLDVGVGEGRDGVIEHPKALAVQALAVQPHGCAVEEPHVIHHCRGRSECHDVKSADPVLRLPWEPLRDAVCCASDRGADSDWP